MFFFIPDPKVLGVDSTEINYFDQEVSLRYKYAKCSLLITFECDRTQHGEGMGPKFESLQNTCNYNLRWLTSLACRPNINVQCSIRRESSDKKTDLQYDFTPLSKPTDNWRVSRAVIESFFYERVSCG